jgi:hypothetical protein
MVATLRSEVGRKCCSFPDRPIEALFVLAYGSKANFFLFKFRMEKGCEFGKVEAGGE